MFQEGFGIFTTCGVTATGRRSQNRLACEIVQQCYKSSSNLGLSELLNNQKSFSNVKKSSNHLNGAFFKNRSFFEKSCALFQKSSCFLKKSCALFRKSVCFLKKVVYFFEISLKNFNYMKKVVHFFEDRCVF